MEGALKTAVGTGLTTMMDARTLVYGHGCMEIQTHRACGGRPDDIVRQPVFFSEEGIAYNTRGGPLPFSFLSLSESDVRERYGDSARAIFRQRKDSFEARNGAVYIPALTPGYWNYYHALVDCLPRVLVALAAGLPGMRVLITRAQMQILRQHLPKFVDEITSAFDLNTYLEIAGGPLLFLEDALVPRQANRFLSSAISKFRLLAERQARPGVRRRLYISRSLASARKVLNEPELLPHLFKHGFEVLHLERVSLAEQIQAFSEAEIICGPHGAGFANMLFARPGSVFIEFLPERAIYKAAVFAELAAVAGCEHAVIRCKDEANARYARQAGNQHMRVACSDLLDMLAWFTGERPAENRSCRPILDVRLEGDLGERMMQFMTAAHIAEKAPGCTLSGVELPEWGIARAQVEGKPGKSGIGVAREQVNIEGLAAALLAGIHERVELQCKARWLSNFPPLETCRRLFPERGSQQKAFGPEFLAAHIQLPVSGDASRVLLPVGFYADVAHAAGLRLAFIGDLHDNLYRRALREQFPDAVFLSCSTPLEEFEVLRACANLIPATTPFSWLAAWLSRAEKIFLPVTGLFHPVQSPTVDLLPYEDERYQFFVFPINFTVSAEEFEQAHAALQSRWRRVTREKVRRLRRPCWPKRIRKYLACFDEHFYLRANPDVAVAVGGGRFRNGLDHYQRIGFNECRKGFRLDEAWYCVQYPQAAVEVGEGDYADLEHHYVETGLARGYKPHAASVLDLRLQGGFAERIMQYMTARHIVSKARDCVISGVDLPEWGIHHSVIEGKAQDTNVGVAGEAVNIEGVATTLLVGARQRLALRTFARWFSNFPDAETCRSVFRVQEREYAGFGPEFLVAHIQLPVQGDSNSVLLPIDFYIHLGQTTGLRLAFLGQLEDNAYCRAVRERFPDAVFQRTGRAMADFQIFRNSHNLIPAPTAFSWLAAWLSRADTTVFLPLTGFLHPVQNPSVNLIPVDDPRYEFYLFPINFAVPVDNFAPAHEALQNRWRWIGREDVEQLRHPAWPRHIERFLEHFDETYYLQTYRDVAASVATGRLSSGLEHYIRCGFKEDRSAFAFDARWYSVAYPRAAVEVGEGDYTDLRHHFVEAGYRRGYKPKPISRVLHYPGSLRRSLHMSTNESATPETGNSEPAIQIQSRGGLANRMIQYMAAYRIASQVEGCRIAGTNLPEWGIVDAAEPSTAEPELDLTENNIDIEQVVAWLAAGEIRNVHLTGFAQWMSNFPDIDSCRKLFPEAAAEFSGFDSEHLVCNIRGGEVLDARHRDYVLLPVEFYGHLAETTGLRLVFMGQLEDNVYSEALRNRFPDAIFQESQGSIADFHIFRNSRNLVPAVSTFSWLAAWLSHADRIFLPVNGLFHPLQSRLVDLLPLSDPRYRFYLFPINYAVPVAEFERANRGVAGNWRYLPSDVVAGLRSAVPKWPRRLDSYLKHFDELYYLQAHPDIAKGVEAKELESGRAHYISWGFAERRICFDFDDRWYAAEYPLAALEVGQGDCEDLRHHFVEAGAMRGYKPVPSNAVGTRWPRRVERYLTVFDEDYYLRTYPDVAAAVSAGLFSGVYHYTIHGFKEGRDCFEFDDARYAEEHPNTVLEVEQGHYADLRHHFAETGFYRGYAPSSRH